MKVAIMQPYFFPYIGYFSLISMCDHWVFFDTPQYIRHGWVNRNRILKPSREDWQYITVPLKKHSREESINNVYPANNEWQRKLMAQVGHYKKVAPYYTETVDLLNEIFNDQGINENLANFNIRSIGQICKYLDISFESSIFSEFDIDIGRVQEPDDWALHITKAIGGDCYINPPGGKEFFNKEKYLEAGIQLSFLNPQLESYEQKNSSFIEGLSIIDVLMFNSINDIKKMLNSFSLE